MKTQNPKELNDSIITKLRNISNTKNVSSELLSEKTGISLSVTRAFKNGKNSLKLIDCLKILEALDIKFSDLV